MLETPDGQVHFQGELSPEETDFVVGIGLNMLLKIGAFELKPAKEQMND